MNLINMERLFNPTVEREELSDDVVCYSFSNFFNRGLKMQTSVYYLHGLLVDSAFSHVGQLVGQTFAGQHIDAIALTHHHEDHCGNAGLLAQQHGCPVYLHQPQAMAQEGVANLLPYRRIYWGSPHPYHPQPMPEVVSAGSRQLRKIEIPGHSQTHVCLFEEATGVLFSGDLFVSPGATAVMAHENPYQSMDSLRRIAALEPAVLLSGHGLNIPKPAGRLRLKADRIEQAAQQSVELHNQGVCVRGIVDRVFSRGRRRDQMMAIFTGREFSRANFVRACIRHQPDPGKV